MSEISTAPGTSLSPKYYAKKIEPGMKLPKDMRLLRDIKLYEVPGWIMKRNFTPMGLYFYLKRTKSALHSKYLLPRNIGGAGYAMIAFWLGVFNYTIAYPELKLERHRKYH